MRAEIHWKRRGNGFPLFATFRAPLSLEPRRIASGGGRGPSVSFPSFTSSLRAPDSRARRHAGPLGSGAAASQVGRRQVSAICGPRIASQAKRFVLVRSYGESAPRAAATAASCAVSATEWRSCRSRPDVGGAVLKRAARRRRLGTSVARARFEHGGAAFVVSVVRVPECACLCVRVRCALWNTRLGVERAVVLRMRGDESADALVECAVVSAARFGRYPSKDTRAPRMAERAAASRPGSVECCAPAGCLAAGPVAANDDDAVRAVCSSERCPLSGLMHRACFDHWESQVLQFLRSCGGRARQWTERQRQHNLWTKKGYDLAFKACSCLCGRGHLRKDAEWTTTAAAAMIKKPACGLGDKRGESPPVVQSNGSRRRRNKNNPSPTKAALSSAAPARAIAVMKPANGMCGSSSTSSNSSSSSSAAQLIMMNQQQQQQMMRQRANSLSSTASTASSSGASSPPEVGSASSSTGASQFAFLSSSSSSSSPHSALAKRRTVTAKADDVDRRSSGNSGLFLHRADFSSFNVLPRHKVNSFHIKMEDEGSYGNDDIRCFILSNLAMARMSKTYCVICQSAMQIYDRYPLIDGTFFLSPKQYSKACIPVTAEGRQQHLCAVCMPCLEGWTCRLRCRSCRSPWDGSALILGTMYSYDVFAAVPCCPDRLRCNQCNNLVIQPTHRFQYFSQYSRDISCPHCTSHQHHFVKALPQVFQLFRSSAAGSPAKSAATAPLGRPSGALVQPEPLSVASALQALASLNFG